jgi:leucyl aminopeptidase
LMHLISKSMKIYQTSLRSLAAASILQRSVISAFAPTTTATATQNSVAFQTRQSSQSQQSLSRSFSNTAAAALSMSASASGASAASASDSKMNQSFPTWSFDKACASMEWTGMSGATLTVESADVSGTDADADADLIMIGVMAPAKTAADNDNDVVDDDSDDEGDDTEVPVTLTGMAAELDAEMGGALSAFLVENHKTFKGGAKMGSVTPTLRLVTPGSTKSKRYVVVGLGTSKADGGAVDATTFAGSANGAGFTLGKAVATKCHTESKVGACRIILPAALAGNTAVIRDFSTSLYQTLYADNRYRTGNKVKVPAADLKTVTIVSESAAAAAAKATSASSVLGDAEQQVAVAAAIDRGHKIATGIYLTKDIVNAPHNVLNSESLAATAKRIAAESGGRITCQILGKEECEQRGMGAYLGVARGSETEPQFIHLTYTPADGVVNKKVGIVGKGLLYDTGGYNIKTSMMELMKFDCGGAAAVLGAARAVGAMAPTGVEAHFIVAACENMINEKAMVASDILTASNGKTIEVMVRTVTT